MKQENIKLKAIIEVIKFAKKMEIKELKFSEEFSNSFYLTKDESEQLNKICKKWEAEFYIKRINDDYIECFSFNSNEYFQDFHPKFEIIIRIQ